MSWFDIWKKHVIWAEDRRNVVYPDSKGIPTVGIGHNLKANPVKDIPPQIGWTISDKRVDELFEEDSRDAIHMVKNIFHDCFDDWSDVRKAMVVDLMFNMGARTFLTFGPTIAHMRAGQWEDVAQHLEATARTKGWYYQVGRRGPRVVSLLRAG